jgi:hypothetical protein
MLSIGVTIHGSNTEKGLSMNLQRLKTRSQDLYNFITYYCLRQAIMEFLDAGNDDIEHQPLTEYFHSWGVAKCGLRRTFTNMMIGRWDLDTINTYVKSYRSGKENAGGENVDAGSC